MIKRDVIIMLDLLKRTPRLTYTEIARKTNISLSQVATCGKVFAFLDMIPSRNGSAPPSAYADAVRDPTTQQIKRWKRVAKARNTGTTWDDIADREGCSKAAIVGFHRRYREKLS